jgi:hypothetical protein
MFLGAGIFLDRPSGAFSTLIVRNPAFSSCPAVPEARFLTLYESRRHRHAETRHS